MFIVTPISAFSDNYIWLLQGADNQVVVVDPGDAQAVIASLEKTQQQLTAILITHHHSDHTGGALALSNKFSVPIYGPNNCKFSGISHVLNDGDSISILGLSLLVKAVPGHTLDHITYFYDHPDTPQLFCGDSLFLAGCGRVFEGSMQQMLEAMHYFKQLPAKTLIYCTHEYSLSNLAFAKAIEPNNLDIVAKINQCHALRLNQQPTLPSSIAAELLVNPFLRCDTSTVQQNAAAYASSTLATELEVFTVLRNWKNVF